MVFRLVSVELTARFLSLFFEAQSSWLGVSSLGADSHLKVGLEILLDSVKHFLGLLSLVT